jgi:hypothetical protein
MKEMEIPQKYFNYGDKIAIKFYNSYTNYFNAISLDASDLCQEVKIAIFTTAKKYGMEKLSIPLINKSVIWRLNQLKTLGIREIQEETITTENNYTSKNKTFFSLTSLDKELIEKLEDKNNKRKEKILDWGILKKILTKLEYDIIYGYFKERKIFQELASINKKSKQRIHQIYLIALKKIKKYYIKKGLKTL